MESNSFSADSAVFRCAFEHAAIGAALVAADGKWLDVNDAACEILGYDKEELLTKTFQDITHPDDLEADLAFVEQMLRGEIENYQMEKRYVHRRGHVVWVLLSVSLARGAANEPLYFISQLQNISPRKEAEKELIELSAMQTAILNSSIYFLVTTDKQGAIRQINPAAERAFGYRAEEIINRATPLALHPPENLKQFGFVEEVDLLPSQAVYEFLAQPIERGAPDFEIEMMHRDGSRFTAQLSVSYIVGDAGERLGLMTVGHDISRRKEAERKREESENALRRANDELRGALEQIKTLQGLMPICSYCKNIRDDQNYWHTIEKYITEHSEAQFSHGICPNCYDAHVRPQISALKRRSVSDD